MQSSWVRRIKWAGLFIAALLFVAFAVTPSQPTRAENERVVTVYHDGIEQTIVTDAKTVGEALERAHVTLAANDTVEPAAGTNLVAPAYSVNVYRARPVTVVDGARRYTIMTSHTSAREIAQAAGITLYDEDTYTVTRIDDFVGEGGVGLKMAIQRATPMRLVMYGKVAEIRTQAKTVGELMADKKIVLVDGDGTNLPVGTPITDGLSLEVWRNGVQTVTNEEEVAFTTKQVRDTDKPVGYREVQTPGVKGKKMVTYQIETKDGKEVSRKTIQSVITQDAKQQVEVIGGQVGFTGAFQDALAQLRQCEAGGHYDRNSGNGYYGAYQYDISTWANYMGYARADLAPPDVQDQKAWETYKRRGWTPWPACSKKLGLQDIYR